MAADQDRAERVRALKQERPDLTWRRIAAFVGVSERAAIEWQKNGGIDYANVPKLAELFEVDVDYIWRGTEGTPSPFAEADATASQLDRIEQMLKQVLARLPATESGEDADLDHLDIPPEDEEPGAQVA